MDSKHSLDVKDNSFIKMTRYDPNMSCQDLGI